MADIRYQKLQAVDKEPTAGDSLDVDAHTPIQNPHTPSMGVGDPTSGPRCQDSRSSDLGPFTNISVGIERCHYSTYISRTPSPDFEDARAGSANQGPRWSEPSAPTSISANEVHAGREPHTMQQGIPLSDSITSMPPTSQEQPGGDVNSGYRRCAQNESAERQPPQWTMLYFRLVFLLSLSIFFILMIAGLEVLFQTSQRNQGLITASEGSHYVWTYGPTFVFTMIATLWGQLEQCAKQIMPWSIMSRGETTAEPGLVLNYITSSMLGSLFRSLKRKHLLVSLGISGSLIMRLAIIFSSGLLRLEYTSVTSTGALVLQDTIDLTRNVDYPVWPYTLPVRNGLGYWSILKYGLSHPSGTTPQFAVQSFVSSDNGAYDAVTGECQVFESTLEHCDPFKFTYYKSYNSQGHASPILSSLPDSVREKLKPWCYKKPDSYADDDFENVAEGISNSFGNLTRTVYKCTNSTIIEDQDHRILVTLGTWLSRNESEVSGFMCEPRYSLTRRDVANITRSVGLYDNLNIPGAITETLDIGIRPFNITQSILDSLGDEEDPDMINFTWNVWFTLLHSLQPQSNPSSLKNTSLAIELSKRLWPGLAAYVVKRDHTYPLDQIINGTTTSTQGRLRVQELSLRVLGGLIAIMLLFNVVLCFLRPAVFSRDPTSLAAHAMILARSSGLITHLERHGAAPKQALRASLSSFLWSYPQQRALESPAISVKQYRGVPEKPGDRTSADNNDTREWWRPLSVRWWFRICVLTATVGLMIALEVLLQISTRENGLGDVSLDGYMKYTWTLLPTCVLALIGLLFSMVDSTARTLHPFQLLRKGRASLEDILYDPARQVSLTAVVRAAWKRHFALFWAILPGLLAPILTIVTSGLYTVVPVPWTYETDLQLKDWFRPENRSVDFENRVESDNQEAWTIFSLMQFANMSYPDWTQGEYALSKFGADNLHSHDGNETSLYVTARVPATRANLNCSLIGKYASDAYLTIEGSWRDYQWLPIDPQPLGCHTHPEWNQTDGHRRLYLEDMSIKYKAGYYLTLFEDTYNFLTLQRYNHAYDRTTSTNVCGDGRQHYFIGLSNGTEALSLLHCVPYVEQLWVTAAFALPYLSLVPHVPVVPDTSSSVILSDSASMMAISHDKWETIFTAVNNGSSRIAGQMKDLMPDPDSDDAHKLIAAVEAPAAEYLAQNFHFNYRHPRDGNYIKNASTSGRDPFTPDGTPATATVTDRTRLRLIQSAVSTRILQSLLGVMVICLAAESSMGRGARVIPRDPGSIASRMAYFAGGELWRHVPVGADRWSDEEIIKWGRENCKGGLLLDWWGGDEQEAPEDEAPQSSERARRFAVDSVSRKGVVLGHQLRQQAAETPEA